MLGHERAHRSSALLLIVLSRYATHLGVVCFPKPTSFGERFSEHPLECGGGMDNDILSVGKTPGLDQNRERCVHL